MSMDVYQEAAAFRRALGIVAPMARASAFLWFPRGSCGDATDLLGTYLRERGAGKFYYVLGEKHQSECDGGYLSHAWLERDGVITDITADQFPEISEPVIVTTDSPWHRTFTARRPRNADFRAAGSPELHLPRDVYDQVLELIFP
jgi:hypothetical protein